MFETIDTEEKAYWLGFLIADGCIVEMGKTKCKYIKLSLKLDDLAHLEKFKKFMGTTNKIYIGSSINTTDSTKRTHSCELKIGSNEICAQLAKYGVIPRKSHIAYLPEVREDLKRHLIRGIWDGDGSVLYRATHKKYPNVIRPEVQLCGTASILNSVQEIFNTRLDITPSKLSAVKSIFLFRKTGTIARTICNYLYKDSSIYLERKYEKASIAIDWLTRKGV